VLMAAFAPFRKARHVGSRRPQGWPSLCQTDGSGAARHCKLKVKLSGLSQVEMSGRTIGSAHEHQG
jgi:hypothetical protein